MLDICALKKEDLVLIFVCSVVDARCVEKPLGTETLLLCFRGSGWYVGNTWRVLVPAGYFVLSVYPCSHFSV